jgi:hypothetical protein
MAKKKPSKAPRKPAAAPVSEGDLDLPLMRRAAAAVPILTPSRMPLLLDAFNSRKEAEYFTLKPITDDIQAVIDFLDGKPDEGRHVVLGVDLRTEIGQKVARDEKAELRPRLNRLEAYLRTAELGAASTFHRHAYFASEEMSALILAGSAKGVEALALTVADLPSPSGFAYFYRPDGKGLFLWWTSDEDDVVASVVTAKKVTEWLASETVLEEARIQPFAMAVLSPAGTDTGPLAVDVHNPFEVNAHDGENDFDRLDAKHVLPILFSFAHMLRQDIVDTDVQETAPAPVTDAKGRRRYRKDRITYLSARRGHTSPGAPDHNRHAREYSVRWVVRGHWRRQWYRSLNRHIPIWITDYIAGPDDAPLVHRDKVTLVTS